MKVLYVEDHAIFAGLVVNGFLAGHAVQVVPSLAGARAALAADRFDVLVVDYDLEDGKGATLVAELRRRGDATPIVAASSHDEGNRLLAQAGANLVCAKRDMDRLPAVLTELGLTAAEPQPSLPPTTPAGVPQPALSITEVLERSDDLLLAIETFHSLATALARRLAQVLHVSLRSLSTREISQREGIAASGEVNRIWSYRFKGRTLSFRTRGGLTVRALLGFEEEFGCLDPSSLLEFLDGPLDPVEASGVVRDDPKAVAQVLQSAPQGPPLRAFLDNPAHTAQALEVLEAAGHLEVASLPGEPKVWRLEP